MIKRRGLDLHTRIEDCKNTLIIFCPKKKNASLNPKSHLFRRNFYKSFIDRGGLIAQGAKLKRISTAYYITRPQSIFLNLKTKENQFLRNKLRNYALSAPSTVISCLTAFNKCRLIRVPHSSNKKSYYLDFRT